MQRKPFVLHFHTDRFEKVVQASKSNRGNIVQDVQANKSYCGKYVNIARVVQAKNRKTGHFQSKQGNCQGRPGQYICQTEVLRVLLSKCPGQQVKQKVGFIVQVVQANRSNRGIKSNNVQVVQVNKSNRGRRMLSRLSRPTMGQREVCIQSNIVQVVQAKQRYKGQYCTSCPVQ